VHGVPLSASGSVDRIRERMGVCPQADILWAELTGREHLHLYGAIKVCGVLGRVSEDGQGRGSCEGVGYALVYPSMNSMHHTAGLTQALLARFDAYAEPLVFDAPPLCAGPCSCLQSTRCLGHDSS